MILAWCSLFGGGPHLASELKLSVTGGVVAVDKRELRKLMRAAGNDIRGKTSRLINQRNGGARRHTVRRDAIPPRRPAHRRSASRAICGTSLKTYVYKSAEGFAVRARQFYALFSKPAHSAVAATVPSSASIAAWRDQSARNVPRRAASGARWNPARSSIASWGKQAPELNRRVGIALQTR